MKTNKPVKRDFKEIELSDKSRQNKDRAINLMVFTIVFFIALLLISQLV